MNAPHADPPETFGRVSVFAIPMRTRFRGITVREGMLLPGPAGWGALFQSKIVWTGPGQ